ncbi:MAG TPA: DUF1800 family protein, partial [Burkholderiaceae bacterium]|nr:DUF1800 family protein [Burkholderiaceae bacterium]
MIRGHLLLALLLCVSGIPASAAGKPLTQEDIHWLNRITYGIDGATVAQYQTLGRKGFLEMQLRASDADMPMAISTTLTHLDLLNLPLDQSLQDVDLANKHINSLTSEDEKQQARKQLNDQAGIALYETNKRHFLRALYSPAQLKEQMVWFWDNHFSVFQGKGNLRWSVADYEEHAIRPH